MHDPLVVNDFALSKCPWCELNGNLASSLKGADLIIIVADHTEYSDLSVEEVGDAVVYDGRGIIDTSNTFCHQISSQLGWPEYDFPDENSKAESVGIFNEISL